jgi:hypothetical protein
MDISGTTSKTEIQGEKNFFFRQISKNTEKLQGCGRYVNTVLHR